MELTNQKRRDIKRNLKNFHHLEHWNVWSIGIGTILGVILIYIMVITKQMSNPLIAIPELMHIDGGVGVLGAIFFLLITLAIPLCCTCLLMMGSMSVMFMPKDRLIHNALNNYSKVIHQINYQKNYLRIHSLNKNDWQAHVNTLNSLRDKQDKYDGIIDEVLHDKVHWYNFL